MHEIEIIFEDKTKLSNAVDLNLRMLFHYPLLIEFLRSILYSRLCKILAIIIHFVNGVSHVGRH